MIKFKKIINLNQSPLFKIPYKKYMNPLKDVKHDKKPVKIIFSLESLILFAITNPKKNDPIIETMKLLFIKNLKKVAI